MIKAIFFDFTGVIAKDGYIPWLKKVVPDFDYKKDFFNKLPEKLDTGEYTKDEFAEILSKEIKIDKNIIWQNVFDNFKINFELLEIILKLKNKYKTGLLTNFNVKPMEIYLNKYDLNKYFDVKIISSVYKIVKPNKEIYQIALNSLKIMPEEALFVDDRQVNVVGGEAVGIKSLLFTTNDNLIEDLRSCMIVIPVKTGIQSIITS